MKKLLILFICGITINSVYAQKKPKLNQAEKERVAGNLAVAKTIIDQAVEFEKLKDDGKTWYYKGLVYANIDTTSNPEYNSLSSNALDEAMNAFAKSDELNKGKNEYYISDANGFPILKSQQISTLWGYYLNKGVEYYNVQNNEQAYNYFEKTTKVLPNDTTGYLYAASVAQASQDYENALKNYYKLTNDLDYHTKNIYYSIIFIESELGADNEKILEIINDAKVRFPNDNELIKSEINTLIKLERTADAKTELENAIKAEPDNPSLYFTLAVMYEELGEVENAKAAYLSSLEVDPDFYNSRFNLAVLSYNQAIELIKKKNNLGITTSDRNKAKSMQSTINKKLNEALVHWEKVDKLTPNNKTVIETLSYIYVELKMYDKAEAQAKKLDNLPE